MGKLFNNSHYIISLNPLHFSRALTILDDDSIKELINSFKTHSNFFATIPLFIYGTKLTQKLVPVSA